MLPSLQPPLLPQQSPTSFSLEQPPYYNAPKSYPSSSQTKNWLQCIMSNDALCMVVRHERFRADRSFSIATRIGIRSLKRCRGFVRPDKSPSSFASITYLTKPNPFTTIFFNDPQLSHLWFTESEENTLSSNVHSWETDTLTRETAAFYHIKEAELG